MIILCPLMSYNTLIHNKYSVRKKHTYFLELIGRFLRPLLAANFPLNSLSLNAGEL